MKIKFLVSYLFLVIGLYTDSRGQHLNPLIAHWDFDALQNSQIADVSGNNYHAKILGGPGQLIKGVKGNALKVIGKGDFSNKAGEYILLPKIPLDSLAEFTFILWVKEDTFSYPHGEAYLWFGIDDGPNRIAIHRAGVHGANLDQFIYFSAGPPANDLRVKYDFSWRKKFVMYSLVFSQHSIRAFINDSLVGSKILAYPVLPVNMNFAGMGTHWWGNYQTTRFVGSFDEMKIYKKALSNEDIKTEFLKIERPTKVVNFKMERSTKNKENNLTRRYFGKNHSKYLINSRIQTWVKADRKI